MKSSTQKVIVVIVLVLIVLFGVGQFFTYSNLPAPQPAQNASSTPATQVIAYAPEVPAPSNLVNGSCFANSIAAPYRADAWRCAVGNAINDPCFQLPNNTSTQGYGTLLCDANPADAESTSSFVLNLTKPLPAVSVPSSTPNNWAWLVQLEDGTVCAPFTGTLPFTADHEVAYYGCTSPSGQGDAVLLGQLNAASSGQWTAEAALLSQSTSSLPTINASATVPVATVWE